MVLNNFQYPVRKVCDIGVNSQATAQPKSLASDTELEDPSLPLKCTNCAQRTSRIAFARITDITAGTYIGYIERSSRSFTTPLR